MSKLVPVLACLALVGCHKDKIMGVSCPETVLQTTDMTTTTTSTSVSDQSAFDIDNVSVLEATDELYGGADAVILDHDASTLPPDSTWRVHSVDVLVMIANVDFVNYPQSVGENSVALTLQVWDANTPINPLKPAYQVRQVLSLSALTWEPVTLSSGSFHKAWWKFDFSNVIPETGMTSAQYLVGVKWESSFEPQVGYSNFNRPCDRNWTNTDGSAWVLNSTQGAGGNMCNWPMLRVNSEARTKVTTTTTVPVTTPVTIMVQRDQCDPTSTDTVTVVDAGTP